MHPTDANGEKDRWELHKNDTYSFKQILEKHLTKKQLYSHLPPSHKPTT